MIQVSKKNANFANYDSYRQSRLTKENNNLYSIH